MRIVVVGAGIIGLLVAAESARAGVQVDLVDQGGIPSPVATSNDLHRVVRALHRDDAALTTAAAAAQRAWTETHRLLGDRCWIPTGVLTALDADQVGPNLALLAAAGADAQVVGPAKLRARYPHVSFASGTAAVLEPTSGVVRAGQALTALAGWLSHRPGTRLWPGHRVISVDDDGAVRLSDGSVLRADRVVVAAGPWSRELLAESIGPRLTLYRQTTLSYAPSARAAWAGTPAVLGLGPERGAWLVPPAAGAPARLSAAAACRAVPEMTGRAAPARWRDYLIRQFSALLTDFDPAAVNGAADGYYLAAPDGGPALAASGDGTVLAYAACGGMSFKFAPLIARSIADRALGGPPRATAWTRSTGRGSSPPPRARVRMMAAPSLGRAAEPRPERRTR